MKMKVNSFENQLPKKKNRFLEPRTGFTVFDEHS